MEPDRPQQVRGQLVSKCGSIHTWFLCKMEKRVFYIDTDILEGFFSHCWGL